MDAAALSVERTRLLGLQRQRKSSDVHARPTDMQGFPKNHILLIPRQDISMVRNSLLESRSSCRTTSAMPHKCSLKFCGIHHDMVFYSNEEPNQKCTSAIFVVYCLETLPTNHNAQFHRQTQTKPTSSVKSGPQFQQTATIYNDQD